MERHAVPQNIMEVEFKLFGALSVKQFAYLAGLLMVALGIYFTPLPGLLRVVLIIISVILGIFLSLIKINGQYSSVWLTNFIVAMFTSQERVWKKTGVVPDVFHEEVRKTKDETLEKVKKEGRIRASIAPLTKFEVQRESTVADREEELRLKQIEQEMFGSGSTQSSTNTQNESQIQTQTLNIISIKGYVVDNQSNPVPNALVSINAESGEFIKEVNTNEKGYFDLGINLAPGVYFASIAAPNMIFEYYKIRLKENQETIYKFKAK
jgi:hypothetical protein